MLGKTHAAVGAAAALLLAEPGSLSGCLLALAGGALGGAAPDMDLLDNENRADARHAHLLAAALFVVLLAVDSQTGFRVCGAILERSGSFAAGLGLYAVLSVFGVLAEHRGFTHSLLALFLFTEAARLVYEPIGAYYLAGYVSHLLLDFLNKKGMRLFFPFRTRVCLGLCCSDQLANRGCLWLGLAAAAALLLFRLAPLAA